MKNFLILICLLCSCVSWAQSSSATIQYGGIQKELRDLALKNPVTTSLFSLGTSDSGQEILGVKIGNGPHRDLLVATHHGNEYGSTEVARAVAQDLASVPMATETVYVIPVLNITGYNLRRRWETGPGNTLVDANRDYPGPCKPAIEPNFTLKSTSALAKFVDSENIVALATLHTFTPVVAYPWGISTTDLSTPYDNIFLGLVKAAALESHYDVGNSTQTIYPADGTFEDYTFWKFGTWSILFELGYSHSPKPAEVQELIKVNVPGIKRLFALSPALRATDHDFHGKCSDAMRRFDRHDE